MKKNEIKLVKLGRAVLTTLVFVMCSLNITKAQAFNLSQTLSDGAQQMTIAFDALAFFTGSIGSDSFFPPGKVADFWGFQYLRDNDPSEMGHNTDFLTKASYNMLATLDSNQFNALKELAKRQIASINQYGYDRFVLMKAFRRLATGDTPTGKSQLNNDAVKNFSKDLYILDGKISYERARVMGGILKSLNNSQRTYLNAMKGNGMLSWPSLAEPEVLKGLTRDEKIAVMTYGGDLFSWYVGSLDADVYFCPERHGTYFGSFYLKDAPAVGNPNYTIGSNLTSDYGNNLLNTLLQNQAQLINNLVAIQKPFLLEIVNKRNTVSELFRQFVTGTTPDSNSVISLMADYGSLDGELNYNYATNFAAVYKALDTAQKSKLAQYRYELIGNLAPSGAYLYSTPIDIPAIINTDFLFTNTATGIEADNSLPAEYKLLQNYPNPFNPSTVISYQIPAAANVSLKIFDILGKEVVSLINEFQSAGTHQIVFSTNDLSLSSGVYLYVIRTGSFVQAKKMILLR